MSRLAERAGFRGGLVSREAQLRSLEQRRHGIEAASGHQPAGVVEAQARSGVDLLDGQ